MSSPALSGQTMCEGSSARLLTSFLGPLTVSRNFVKSPCSTKYAAPLVNEKSVVSIRFIFCEDWKLPSTAWKKVSRYLLMHEQGDVCPCSRPLTHLRQGGFASWDPYSCPAEGMLDKAPPSSRAPGVSWAPPLPAVWLAETRTRAWCC